MPTPDQLRRRRLIRTAMLCTVVLVLGAMVLGLGDVVRAALDPPQPVQPYDPLVSW
jgi:hypothetical protein